MRYLTLPLDRHFDLGFGAVADSFKEAADSLKVSNDATPNLNSHLPISFLYRHSIELYFKSAIIIFHKKLALPYGNGGSESEPQVLIKGKWKPMYSVHGLLPLYDYFRHLFAANAYYLQANTKTDWSFPDELANWINELEDTDSSSTFFRYPITRHGEKDKEKSSIQRDSLETILSNLAERERPLKAFLMVDQDDEVIEAFSYNLRRPTSIISTLSKVAELLYCCHAALVGELTGGA